MAVVKVPATALRLLSTSVSLAISATVELNGVSSVAVTASSKATGASLTAATVTLTVAELDVRLPSVVV